MNYAKGGRRVLLVLLILQWLIVGGITVSAAFFEPTPTNLPYASSFWRDSLIGAGGAALLCSYGFYSFLDPPAKGAAEPGGTEFVLGLWGMASSFLGWLAGAGLVVAAAGGWDSMGTWFFRNLIGAALPTAVTIGIIWCVPIAVLGFFVWLWDGFASKQS